MMEKKQSIDSIEFEEELEKLKDYLLNKFAVPNISNEVTIYKYDNGLNYFDATKIFDEIVKLVKNIKEKLKSGLKTSISIWQINY